MQDSDGKVAVAVPRHSDSGKFLLLKRSEEESSSGLWNFPGGFIEEGEELREAALRELEEETGLNGEVVDSTDDFHWGGNVGIYKIHGFLVEVSSGKVELDREHSEFEWINIEELEEFETVGKLKVVEQLGLKQ